MSKILTFNVQEIARQAALAEATAAGLGSFIELIDEGDGAFSYQFASTLKGYRDWRWTVVIFQATPETEPTVSEVVLMPGQDSLIAPDWVPWSERLADYKALQIELEAQAALDAAEAAEGDQDEDSESTEDAEVPDGSGSEAPKDDEDADFEDESVAEGQSLAADESAVSDPNQADNAEGDADRAGIWPKRLFGRRKARVKGQDRKKGKNPKS